MINPLVSADELLSSLDRTHVVDFRWKLGDPSYGRRSYEEGHIPGAVFVDLEDVTGTRSGEGRHPLPARAQFEAAMRLAGLRRGADVVVYDDAGGSAAARLWWLLRAFGHEEVAVLDGGIAAWKGGLESGVRQGRTGDFVAAEPDLSQVLTYDEVRALDADAVLLDVRAPERYRGESEPVDPIAGHVPGAKNAFWQEYLMDDGKIASSHVLRERFARLGVTDGSAVVYCGSGVVASQTLLALESAGLGPVRFYAGGWSDWANREGAPVASGPGDGAGPPPTNSE